MKEELNKKRTFLFVLAHLTGLTCFEKVLAAGYLSDTKVNSMEEFLLSSAFLEKKRAMLIKQLNRMNVQDLLENYSNKKIGWITIFDSIFPHSLREIHDPPIVLFYKGDLSLLERNKIGVVGSRKGSEYGKTVTQTFLKEWLEDFVIVSGLAKGIDAFAHTSAIKTGGNTIAVVGTGLDVCYPKENTKLQKYISNYHLVLSEFPIGTPPLKHHFPLRNRLIAGLSLGIVVVEAENRSGSLITAHIALEEGKEVFCIPGNVFSALSKGSHQLIQQGAHCLYEPELLRVILEKL